MKRVHLDGYVSYHTVITLPDGLRVMHILRLSPEEMAQGRKYVAQRLSAFRKRLRKQKS